MTIMTPRQRVLRAVSRQVPDRVPKDISWGFTPSVLETFKKMTGSEDPEEYFGVEVRFVGLDLPPERAETAAQERRETFGQYFQDLPASAEITEWGTAHLPGTFYHFIRMIPPMRSFSSIQEFEDFPLPSFEESWRGDYARQRI